MFTLNCNGRLLVAEKPLVMGIINVTPDSFYAESRKKGLDDVLRQADMMLSDGASILDIGGQSTRPGSEKISAEEELSRVLTAIEAVHKNFPAAFISIDTYYARVAREAVSAGASIVNDISAGSIDSDMIDTVASLQVPYVLMHMPGTPQTMQQHVPYENVTRDIFDFLNSKIAELRGKGITDIIIDPGFGFGKSVDNNFELLNKLEVFMLLGYPLLLGISRKSFIYKTLGIPMAEALNGTTVANTIGLMKGAAILRVHDVKEAVQAIQIVQALTHR
jgi:dihydropteroate synthase